MNYLSVDLRPVRSLEGFSPFREHELGVVMIGRGTGVTDSAASRDYRDGKYDL